MACTNLCERIGYGRARWYVSGRWLCKLCDQSFMPRQAVKHNLCPCCGRRLTTTPKAGNSPPYQHYRAGREY